MGNFLKNISPFNNRTVMPKWTFILKKVLIFFFCYAAGLGIAEGLAILLHFVCGKNIFKGEMFDDWTIGLITYYGYCVMLAVTLLYWKFIQRKPLKEMGLTKRFNGFFLGAVIGVLLVSLSLCLVVCTGNIEYLGNSKNSYVLSFLLLLGGFIIQGGAEEVLCRGLVFHSLQEKCSLKTAFIISTCLFILPHVSGLFVGGAVYGVIGVINLILISAVFSGLTMYFKNVWAAWGVHSFWNALLYGMFGLNLSGNQGQSRAIFYFHNAKKNIWNGGEYGIEASLITSFVLLGCLAVMYLLYKRKAKKDKETA